MNLTNRQIHRDVAYFYVGLILAFSFSGIILNHRQSWYPTEYAYESEEVQLKLPKGELTEQSIRNLVASYPLEYESHRLRGNSLRIDFADRNIMEINTEDGKGVLEARRTVPLLGHTIKLHKSTDTAWIWYSDIFGAAMILIAITGMMIPMGKNGFKTRGWKLMLAGLIFPLLFLFVL
ncbi:PepSY-associated TM helix domain-containing protein [Robiginitalea aurantiaca]|uniref:PepSY-associated TM helix domain-containing protein n=1 Tax=Robiginitalea aurantiaca TaxID=3056915 RepID=A0ABT7WIR2_9FLAO|nr:PepSY-associated TM helix domain-containing protein [Robiginitalea aurantiaca]MDM9632785.1 PepSY-associated TM helix domain-containing protein [Robiginitalea aurantiaca]